MQKKTEEKIIDISCIIGFIIFSVLGMIAVATKNVEFIYDRFFSALIMLLIYFMHRRIRLRLYAFSLMALTLILHHLKLYGYVFFYIIEFDMIMHFLGGLALAVIFYDWLSRRLRASGESRFDIALFVFLAATGLTSMNEIIEYFGAYFLGSGQGLLYYGAGDFGAYADTAWDLICNSIGAITAVVIMSVITGLSYKKRAKK